MSRKNNSASFKSASAVSAAPLIRFNNTYRDGIQSLKGTNPSAEEIVAAHPNAGKMFNGTLQTCGGTFFDIPARKGRDPGEFVETINAAFPGVVKTALIRGDCLFNYRRHSYDEIKLMVLEHAKAGVNILQNFHGLNDTRMQASVARAANEVRAETGLDIVARGTICIEDNRNITVKSCLKAAEELIASGHQGFYLKSASGRLRPEFVGELVEALVKRFPEQTLDIHAHDTYGEAMPSYMAAIEAALKHNHAIGVDVLHPAIAGNTGQPCALKMLDLIEHHSNLAVRANKPPVNMDAIDADMNTLLELRHRYRASETKFNPDLRKAMYKARAAGGASATLRAIPQLEATLSQALGTTDWDEIQIAIYKMQAKILPRLGDPTQVTPYALIVTKEAAYAVARAARGMDPLCDLLPETASMLTGGLGKVPETAESGLLKLALKKMKLEAPLQFVPADQLPSTLEAARKDLKEGGVENPSNWDLLTAACVADPSKPTIGRDLIIAKYAGKLSPQKAPQLAVEKYLNGIGNEATTMTGHWMGKATPGIGRDIPPLEKGFFKAMGEAAGFEVVAQAILELHQYTQHATPARKGIPREIMHTMAKCEALWQQRAAETLDRFRMIVTEYCTDNLVSKRQMSAMREIIQDICHGKGVMDLEQSFIPRFDDLRLYRRETPGFKSELVHEAV